MSYHAQRLCHLHREEVEIEGFLLLLTQNPEFEFYQKVFNRSKNDVGEYLGKIVDVEKGTGKPVRLVRMRVAAKAVRLLFKELVKAKS